ncbi:OsmC family protein [Termitidicoccus mucosus]|uniref:Osmotically inducible protein OsmC n=1 Tax=Termitidicoccus mucosus TaxID=1184151 RepID=A0A178INF8_9BACT|nr:osmotically inducible protein OsmC [Opitutaceae bacterium TSB47]
MKNIRLIIAAGLSMAGFQTLIHQSLHAQATHAVQDWAQTPAAPDDGSSLRGFQTRLRSAILLAQKTPEIEQPVKLSARVTAAGRTGIRRLTIRNFQLLSDGAPSTAEFNLAAGSWPSVVGALGSAVAGDYLTQAALKGIPIDSLEVIFTSRPGTAPSQTTGQQVTYPRGLAYIAFITSPATDAQLEDLRRTVERVSPVLRLVIEPQRIDHGKIEHIKTPDKLDPQTLDGLREFLTDKYKATKGAKPFAGAEKPLNPDNWQPPLRAHIKVEGDTGIRNIRTDISNFQVIHDFPRYLAGHNLGPVPEEDILGRMITCLTHIYEIVASQKQVRLDSLELEVEGTLTTRLGNTDNPPTYKDIAYRARIGSPESKETIDELQRAVESICPIYNMLKDSQPVKGSIVRGPYTEAKERAAYE